MISYISNFQYHRLSSFSCQFISARTGRRNIHDYSQYLDEYLQYCFECEASLFAHIVLTGVFQIHLDIVQVNEKAGNSELGNGSECKYEWSFYNRVYIIISCSSSSSRLLALSRIARSSTHSSWSSPNHDIRDIALLFTHHDHDLIPSHLELRSKTNTHHVRWFPISASERRTADKSGCYFYRTACCSSCISSWISGGKAQLSSVYLVDVNADDVAVLW